MRKTVVDLDLMGYSRLARDLEDAAAVFAFNEEIQGYIDRGLEAAAVDRPGSVLATTGDGAILAFDEAAAAHHFARGVHAATRQANQGRPEDQWRRFRIGAATGEVEIRRADGQAEFAGTSIADAVRLQTAGRPGDLLVDRPTFDALPPDLKLDYEPEETVHGKEHDPPYPVRRCLMVRGLAPPEKVAARIPVALNTTVAEVYKLYAQLVPRERVVRVIPLIGIPAGEQPSLALNLDQRFDQVVLWAQERAQQGALKELHKALLLLLQG
jgi:class 3 adenylate cyclase